jgi:hypothetical protein
VILFCIARRTGSGRASGTLYAVLGFFVSCTGANAFLARLRRAGTGVALQLIDDFDDDGRVDDMLERPNGTSPGADFVLRFNVTGRRIVGPDAVRVARGNFFAELASASLSLNGFIASDNSANSRSTFDLLGEGFRGSAHRVLDTVCAFGAISICATYIFFGANGIS